MLWKIDNAEIDGAFLGHLKPIRVLVDFDGPRSYIAQDPRGELLFLHQCGQGQDTWRYAVVPFTADLELQLENGQIDVWTALSQTRFYIADISDEGKLVRCYKSNLSSIPNQNRPKHGVTLHIEHNALLSVRAMGAGLELGRASLGILRDQLDAARKGLRLLAEAAHGIFGSKGQPQKELRNYYDLPALLLPGSVQVSVYPPLGEQQRTFEFDDKWNEMSRLLSLGLKGLNEEEAEAIGNFDPQVKSAVIKAVYALAPPPRGAIEQTEISGRLLPRSHPVVKLSRDVRPTLSKRLKTTDDELSVVVAEGIISEMDLEVSTCLLRNADGVTIHKMRFAHELYPSEDSLFEDVKRSFDQATPVRVVGLRAADQGELFLFQVRSVTTPNTVLPDQNPLS